MAITSWERFEEVRALMSPGDVPELALDLFERAARTGIPVELVDEELVASRPARPPRASSVCHGCGRRARPGVVRLKGGFCGPCRAR
jgi:hypothetical protein